MKQILIIIFALLFYNILAQKSAHIFTVTSFKSKPDNIIARANPLKDPLNGGKCALIKILTNLQLDFKSGDMISIVKTEKTNEGYDIWLPQGSRVLTISENSLGKENYIYDLPIEEQTVYEMQIYTEGKIPSQYISIKAEPKNAMIYVDNNYEGEGIYSKRLKIGMHSYKVEHPLYHTVNDSIELLYLKDEVVVVNLKPAFGFLNINTTPENEAKIFIDNVLINSKTPFKSDKILSGKHTIKVVKNQYQPVEQQVIIEDSITKDIIIELKPSVGNLKIETMPDASLFINSEYKAKGKWNGKLEAGIYTIEARKEKYDTAKQDIEMIAGKEKELKLMPKAITGSLSVVTKPFGADISIDSHNEGQTPKFVSDIIIGNHSLKISKKGYETKFKQITITKGNTLELNENLKETNIPQKTINPNEIELDGISKKKWHENYAYAIGANAGFGLGWVNMKNVSSIGSGEIGLNTLFVNTQNYLGFGLDFAFRRNGFLFEKKVGKSDNNYTDLLRLNEFCIQPNINLGNIIKLGISRNNISKAYYENALFNIYYENAPFVKKTYWSYYLGFNWLQLVDGNQLVNLYGIDFRYSIDDLIDKNYIRTVNNVTTTPFKNKDSHVWYIGLHIAIYFGKFTGLPSIK